MSTEAAPAADAAGHTSGSPADQAPNQVVPPADVEEPAGGNSEAAKYRRRLRETEAHRDTLSTRVERLQRAEVERAAAKHLAQGSDVFLFTELADLLDDDGEVDETKVDDAARLAAGNRPGLRHSRVDLGQGARVSTGADKPSWSRVIGRG